MQIIVDGMSSTGWTACHDPGQASGWSVTMDGIWWCWHAYGPLGSQTGYSGTQAEAETMAKRYELALRNAAVSN